MAVADLLTLLLMPFVLASIIYYTWIWGDVFCKFFQFCSTFSLAASIYSLCVVSIARARIILRPYRTPKTTTLIFMIISVWTLSFMVSLPLRIQATVETRLSTNISFCVPTPRQQHYQVLLSQFILYYLIPISVIACNYIRIVLFLQKSPVMSVVSSQNTRRASIKILTATATFSACWLPVYILELCIYLGMYHHSYLWDSFYFACNILQYLHPCVNPVLYVFLAKRYRDQKKIFLCCQKNRVHPQILSVTELKERT
ncbi:hypothetical protein JRQ81_015530 [Phrynocephalus forsythii]|uniref:G-protein coupled receptors family 1 profile domain-containing protein n=1 Tax=Phrynocephalus forsythii TaxID=171643 RepID=A0A9Q0XXE8_9SAUR|nr:hypothetical protein JRQ81_015530 [Phrynocephalus forsythii]